HLVIGSNKCCSGLCIRLYVVTGRGLRSRHHVLASMAGNRFGTRFRLALLEPGKGEAGEEFVLKIKWLLCLRAYPGSLDFYRALWREPYSWIHLFVPICTGSDTHDGRNGAQSRSPTNCHRT